MAYIAIAGWQFDVKEADGRRVPYVRTTGNTPMTGNPHQPMPTWAVRTEARPQVAERPNRLGESMLWMTQGRKAYQGPGTGLPGRTPRSYGPDTTRPPRPGGPAGCMLCGDPQLWVLSRPLIPEEARRVAAQRKAACGGNPPRESYTGASSAEGGRLQTTAVLAIEEDPPRTDDPKLLSEASP